MVVIIRLDRIIQHLTLDSPIKSGNDRNENIYIIIKDFYHKYRKLNAINNQKGDRKKTEHQEI
jgi:hypothetical protein